MKNQILKRFFFLVFLSLCTYAQAQSISGTVSDSTGPLPGASIVVKGTNNGTTSDFDGNFKLENVVSDAVLQVSYVGYTSQEISVSGK